MHTGAQLGGPEGQAPASMIKEGMPPPLRKLAPPPVGEQEVLDRSPYSLKNS